MRKPSAYFASLVVFRRLLIYYWFDVIYGLTYLICLYGDVLALVHFSVKMDASSYTNQPMLKESSVRFVCVSVYASHSCHCFVLL